MDQVFQTLIDRSRTALDLDTIKTILGYRRRPRYRTRKRKSAEWEVTVEKAAYDLTIFRLHCGKLTLKIYTKGERVLRIEAMAHNVTELDCGRSLEKFPRIIAELKGMLERFMQSLSCIDPCFIPDDTLERLPAPSVVGMAKVGGIDFHKARMRRCRRGGTGVILAPQRVHIFGTGGSSHAVQPRCHCLQSPTSRLRSQETTRSRWQKGSGERAPTERLRQA